MAGAVAGVLTLALAPMAVVGATSSAAYADTIDGCTIVAHPTPTNFTNCPGDDLSGANLSGVNLNYADLSGADLTGPISHRPVEGCRSVRRVSGGVHHLGAVIRR